MSTLHSTRIQDRNRSLAEDLRRDPGCRFVAALAAVCAAVAGVDLIGLGGWPAALPVVAVAALAGAQLTLRWRLSTAVCGWAVHVGFVVNAYGELTFGGFELALLGLLVAALAVVGGRRRER